MTKKKLVTSGLVSVLLVGLLAGCAGSNNNSGASPSGAAPSASAAPSGSAAPSAAPKTTTTLTMLFAESLFGGIHADLIKEFETANPDIKVKAESLPDGGIFDALRVKISTGEVPDLYQINIGHVTTGMANEAGLITDLKDMESMKNYVPSVKEASKVGDKVANFSLGVGVLGFPYDKKALAAIGVNEPFKTWDEMMAAGKKLKDQKKDLLVYSSKWETGISNVFHWTFGARALKDPAFKTAYLSNKIDWSVPANRDLLKEGFQKFKELNQYVRSGSFTNEYAIAQQSFTNGESAMILGGTWEAGAIRKLKADIDLGFMNLPYTADQENPYIFVPEDGIALNAKSKNPDAAKKLLNWLFSKETYAKIQKAKGSMSSITGVGELDPAYKDVPQWLGTNRVISFGNTGPIPGPTWVALGQSAQKYTFDNNLDAAIDRFITEYNKTKSK